MMRGKQCVAGLMLIEVTLALGIVVFGLVAVLGLLPVGLGLVRDTAQESVAANVLAAVAADLRSAEGPTSAVYQIALGTAGTGEGFFDETGHYLGATYAAGAVYKVVWTLRSRDPADGGEPNAYLCVGWPAAAERPAGQVEALVLLRQNPQASPSPLP